MNSTRRTPPLPESVTRAQGASEPAPGLARVLEVWRVVPTAQRVNLIISHIVLFAGFAWSKATYLEFQLLIAAELVLTNLATIPLYPGRGWRGHAGDVAKLIPGMAVLMGFVLIAYGVVAGEANEPAVEPVLRAWSQIDSVPFTAFIGWIIFHHAAALWRAQRSPNPRLCWVKERLLDGGATFVALLVMIFASFFVALPLAWLARFFSAQPPVDLTLIAMMVIFRLLGSLLLAAMPDDELTKMAADPYLQPASSRKGKGNQKRHPH